MNSLTVRLPQVLDWLKANPVDVLALQELKLTNDKFPFAALAGAGYQAQCFGQKTYNGVALLTREPALNVVRNIPGFSDDMARVISADVAGVRVIGGYFPNGQEPGSDKFEYKMSWLKGLRDWVRAELQAHPQLVLMGDFNIAPLDTDVWNIDDFAGATHVSVPERQAFEAFEQIGLRDVVRERIPTGYTYWDYQQLRFPRNEGMRIDFVLGSEAFAERVTDAEIVREERKGEGPSDHVPVVVTIA